MMMINIILSIFYSISTDADASLRIESLAIITLRGVPRLLGHHITLLKRLVVSSTLTDLQVPVDNSETMKIRECFHY